MASYNRQQASFSPQMDGNPPVPPLRDEFRHREERETFLPEAPMRMDLHSQQSPTLTRGAVVDAVNEGIRKKECSCNYNRYATKKTIGHGFLEFALITSNAMQLRTLLIQKQHDGIWIASLVLVCVSMLAQLGLAYILIVVGKGDIQNPNKQEKLEKFNNLALFITGLISIINVIINVFMSTTNAQSFLGPAAGDSSNNLT